MKSEKLQGLNQRIRNCVKCRLHLTRRHALPGEGDPNAKLFLVAQAPGENEDREGRMFIGPSGEKLDGLFREIGLHRDEVYLTNLIKCMLPKYRKPKQDEIQACAGYLDEEIRLVNPSVIATLGYYSTHYIFEKYDIPLPKSRKGFSTLYGKLFLTDNRKILPLRHPTTLLYEDSIRDEMLKNYRKLKTLMVDCKWYPVCPIKKFYEEGKLNKRWIELYCKGDWKNCVRYQMEENRRPHPDYMLPDGSLDKSLINR